MEIEKFLVDWKLQRVKENLTNKDRDFLFVEIELEDFIAACESFWVDDLALKDLDHDVLDEGENLVDFFLEIENEGVFRDFHTDQAVLKEHLQARQKNHHQLLLQLEVLILQNQLNLGQPLEDVLLKMLFNEALDL